MKFPGSSELLKKEKDESGDNFYSVLTELNLANKAILSGAQDIEYEKQRKVDFTFDNLIFSVKSLNVKEYEKKAQEISSRLRAQGGGKDSFSYQSPERDLSLQ